MFNLVGNRYFRKCVSHELCSCQLFYYNILVSQKPINAMKLTDKKRVLQRPAFAVDVRFINDYELTSLEIHRIEKIKT